MNPRFKPVSIPGTNKAISEERVFVIAEIGKNFIETEAEQDVSVYLENTKKLIDAAVEAGADAVKFQTHEVEDEQANILITAPHFKGADRVTWVTRNTRSTPLSFWQEVKKYCEEKGIIFFSTPMSRMAAQKLMKVDPPIWKVASGDVQDYVLLDALIQTKKPIIISSGQVSLAELDEIVKLLECAEVPIVILYCVSKYPCPPAEFNLGTIEYLQEKYPHIPIGFSDHSIDGHDVDLAAIKLGARVIEKHFSFSRDLWGADHAASITPVEMKAMVSAIRNKEYEHVDPQLFYGAKDKELDGANNQFRQYFNKALVAGQDIPEGAVITKEMVFAMRPKMYLNGLPSDHFYKILGKRTKKALKKFDPILAEHLE